MIDIKDEGRRLLRPPSPLKSDECLNCLNHSINREYCAQVINW